jgi:inner membrane protein
VLPRVLPCTATPVCSRSVDPVTHILLGASLGYATLGRKLGRAAALAGGLAAFAPDADVFVRSASDPLFAIEHHRGFTHSFAFAPVGTTIVASLWLFAPAWRTRSRWLLLWLACLLGYVSHALLDAATTYGTQLLWPFSRYRAGWDLISIIDPGFTLALGIGVAWALLRQTLRPAILALAFAGGYLALGRLQHARAIAAQRTLAAERGHRIERFAVMPTFANNVIWRALYLHRGAIHSDRIRVGWFSSAKVREGWSLRQVRTSNLSAAEKSRDSRYSFARFAWFSNGWAARSPTDASVIADMRYTLAAEAFDPIWGIRFTAPGESTEVVWVNRTSEHRIMPDELWTEITGRDPRYFPIVQTQP